MHVSRVLVSVAAVALVAGCGVDAGGAGDRPRTGTGIEALPSVGEVSPPAPPAIASSPDSSGSASTPAMAETADVADQQLQQLEQPAIWPAADVVFATPDEAAADFVREVLISDGEPELGEFQQGDARSGEIVVFFPGESAGATPSERGLLALRQLGPDDGWFVIAASSDGANIATPAALAAVAAGPLRVEGTARGFEATVVVSAFPAGDRSTLLDQEIASGGAFADLEPYSATLDLSDATPGEVIVILVQGDTGLGNDPSTFAAIPVVAEEIIPATR